MIPSPAVVARCAACRWRHPRTPPFHVKAYSTECLVCLQTNPELLHARRCRTHRVGHRKWGRWKPERRIFRPPPRACDQLKIESLTTKIAKQMVASSWSHGNTCQLSRCYRQGKIITVPQWAADPTICTLTLHAKLNFNLAYHHTQTAT